MKNKIPKGYKELKDYSIKTRITIKETRKKFSNGRGSFIQPFECYSYKIDYGNNEVGCGGFKNKKELIKSLIRELNI